MDSFSKKCYTPITGNIMTKRNSLIILLAVILATVFLLQLVLTPLVVAEPFAPSAEGVLSFPIPPDISKEEILHPEEPLKARLHSLVIESLVLQNRLSQETGDLIEGKEDLVVVFIDQAGRPILPDLNGAKSRRSDVTNELTFTFNSPTYPWSEEELTTISTALNDFYPTTKTIYGDPAFNITVNIRKDPTISFPGLYYVSLNEIVLKGTSSMDVLCHEMIHAFRDDNIISLNSYEEGMTRAAEVEVFNRLANYTHWNENHSYAYDVYYEGLNRQVIGSQYGNFFNANLLTHLLTRYQLAGYAWAKALLENSNFLVDFNRELYARTLSDPPTPSTESKLLAIATAVQSTVEGKPFQTWYGQQGVLNTNPPKGYFLYQRINQFTVDYFYRDPSGSETMQQDATIQWAVYDNQDVLLDSGSAVTTSYGWISISPALPPGYTGRIKVVATTSTPDGSISDISLRYAGSETGVFGIVPESSSGTITITPLDEPIPPVISNVVNGAFSAPSLTAVKGRFLTDFTDTNGQSFSKLFTKDASNYFLIMDKVTTPGGITVVSPNGGENWARETTQTIRWNYTGSPGSFVNITLLKGGVLNRTINSSVPIGGSGSGSYSWLINSTQTSGTNYKVRITSTTNATYNDTSDNNFTILAIPAGYSYIYGTVMNESVGIAGALVITNTSVSNTTDTSGFYSLLVPAGKYNITASKEPAYYKNGSVVVTAISGTSVLKDIMLTRKLTGTISGTVQRD